MCDVRRPSTLGSSPVFNLDGCNADGLVVDARWTVRANVRLSPWPQDHFINQNNRFLPFPTSRGQTRFAAKDATSGVKGALLAAAPSSVVRLEHMGQVLFVATACSKLGLTQNRGICPGC